MNGAPSQSLQGTISSMSPGKSPAPPVRPRPKAPANPLVANRRKAPLKPQAGKPASSSSAKPVLSNGKPTSQVKSNVPSSARPSGAPTARTKAFAQRPPSPDPPGRLTKIPVFTTKRALLEGLRHHVARLQSKMPVDITDQNLFTRPVRLHRRDPAARPTENQVASPDLEAAARDEVEGKERERVDAIKAENKRIREENQKQIAPSASAQKKKTFTNKKKAQQVYRPNDTVEEQKRSQLRYEEAYPWHIEDDDNKHVWMGAYEESLSDCHLLFIREANAVRVLPAEKYYRFKEKGKSKQLDIDTVNELLGKKSKEPRFIMLKKMEMEKKKEQNSQTSQARFAKKGANVFAGAGGTRKVPVVKAEADGDDLFGNADLVEGAEEVDFENDDLFDDDDEGGLIQGDDEGDVKDITEKIKKEQLGANFFDRADEEEVDREEEEEAKRSEFQKKADKKFRKALLKREKNFNYEADSDDENPYSSGSADEESSVEGEDDQKSPEKNKAAATKGETTPSGRRKHADGTSGKGALKRDNETEMSEASGNESNRPKKLKVAPNLKRPGSPDASGASGNESSRKKQKLGNAAKSLGAVAANRQVSSLRVGAGSGSESESSRRKLQGRVNSSSKPTPSGSRAQSPAGRPAGGSRAASPATSDLGFPTQQEVLKAIPAEGMSSSRLISIFRPRISNSAEVSQFVTLIRSITYSRPKDRDWIFPGSKPKSSG